MFVRKATLLKGIFYHKIEFVCKNMEGDLLLVTKVAPVFAGQKTHLQDKYLTTTYESKKKSETSFQNLLEKELQKHSKIDIKF